MKVTVIGSGYVGLVTGVCLSDIGHEVKIFDINQHKIKMLESGQVPFYEPGLEKILKRNVKKNNLFFTSQERFAFADTDIVFIAVGTPPGLDGEADLTYVFRAVQNASSYMKENSIIIVKSTVPAGTTEKLNSLCKKLVPNKNLTVASNPEFLREGSAVKDFYKPDRIVIGANNDVIHEKIKSLYALIETEYCLTTPESAEMIKYASNALLAVKISFINEVALLCEEVGADVEEVALGVGKDKRIGSSFLRAGIGYGGSCFPKDTEALIYLASQYNKEMKIVQAAKEVNDRQINWMLDHINQSATQIEHAKIAVLGLAFKPETDDIRESPALRVIDYLLQRKAEVQVFDPKAMPNTKNQYGTTLSYHETVEAAVENTDIVLVLTEWEVIIKHLPAAINSMISKPVIIDGRNCLERIKLNSDIRLVQVGKASEETEFANVEYSINTVSVAKKNIS
ncbi:UDP-glucose 6-dehydrogenase [Jeotgalibacillus malaysiensis]|uniref:UDP-glucose 6-dehydrogenase n=1 Tax=Jeotgalibacillus malaysiensis TaxID=1508404 RepID=A0A0B5AR35_9BACL|nr:UDP-glucose/GDP-mannose dehydrogenase family protein [Jeotgalibacillus malaysiensis]AJD92695.1 UDP-glucose 6-dehydrogenase [Jeotgalibacillus malaysiensis]